MYFRSPPYYKYYYGNSNSDFVYISDELVPSAILNKYQKEDFDPMFISKNVVYRFTSSQLFQLFSSGMDIEKPSGGASW